MQSVEARRKKWPIVLAGPKTLTYWVKASSDSAAASAAAIISRKTARSNNFRCRRRKTRDARKKKAMTYSLTILKVVSPEPSMKQAGKRPEKIAKSRATVLSP